MKKCSKCKHLKELTAFSKSKSWCKFCVKAYREDNKETISERRKVAYKINREHVQARNRIYREANKEKVLLQKKAHYNANRKKYLSQAKIWRTVNQKQYLASKKDYYKANKEKWLNRPNLWSKANPDKRNAMTAKRRSKKMQATPLWLTKKDLKQIAEWYTIAKDLQWLSEEPLQVDHIIPLQGENVCGLHVPWNLQILLRSENLSKGNRVW